MLVQLHWILPGAQRSGFIMQGEVESLEECTAWLFLCKEKWGEFEDQRPPGCVPYVCTESSWMFLKAKSDVGDGAGQNGN